MVTNNSGTAKNSNQGGGPNTGLIAGLTTGLVCAALITLTAALLIYRKRKRAQMTDIKRTSPESPASPHTEIVMTAPISPKIKVPPMSVPAASVATPAVDHYQDQYIGSPLFIPPLSATTTNNSNPPTTTTTIQRSLTLSARPQYDPSKTLAINNINRSSSVKVTKYDHNPPVLDDDDLDHVQIRRAISVKRRNAAAHSAYLAPSATPLRSSSLRSQKAKVSTTTASICQEDIDDDDDSLDEATPTNASSGAIQVVCAKPAIARIRSISRKDSGKKANKEDQDQIKPSQDASSSSQPQPLERMSMRSMPDSTHSSILADGEITVYWQPPSN